MIIPNKTLSLDDSALGLSSHILELGSEPVPLTVLWKKVQRKYPSIEHFIVSLEVLYVLEKIEVSNGVVTYVE